MINVYSASPLPAISCARSLHCATLARKREGVARCAGFGRRRVIGGRETLIRPLLTLTPESPAKRSQSIPKSSHLFPKDSQCIPKSFPILCLFDFAVNTRRFSLEIEAPSHFIFLSIIFLSNWPVRSGPAVAAVVHKLAKSSTPGSILSSS
jgi:hypothetical protein